MSGWYDIGYWEYEQPLPQFEVEAPKHFAHPVGFIDFRHVHAKAENKRNESDRRCRISTIKMKG